MTLVRVHLGSIDFSSHPPDIAVTIIRPGQANGLTYPASLLQSSVNFFENAAVFLNHPSFIDMSRAGGRDVRDLAGVIHRCNYNGGVQGRIRPTGPNGPFLSELANQIIADREAGLPVPNIGLSADMLIAPPQGKVVTAIKRVISVDVVFEAAAGGTFDRVLNSILGGVPMQTCPLCSAFLKEDGTCPNNCALNAPSPPADVQAFLADIDAARQRQDEIARVQCGTLLTSALNAADLPEPLKGDVRDRFEGRIFAANELTAALEAKKALWAKLLEDQVIKGVGQPRSLVGGMWDSVDRVQLAFNRLMGLEIPSEQSGIPRLTGLRELYLMLTGDWEFHGVFHPNRVQLANVDCSTVTSLVKNALNLVMLDYFHLNADWWKPIVYEEDFPTMDQVTWITTGGFGDFPTVSEGAAYTELTWSDNEETSNFVKKGGYIGITLEMIDRDKVSSVKAIPRKLGLAAWRTLSTLVSDVFTSNSGVGPTLSDSKALFHADHGNLRTVALSAAEWDVVIQAMFKQAEATSGKRLGLRPAYILVPIELEKTALTIALSEGEPGTADNDLNVRGLPKDRIVTVPEWTDTNNWAAVADPKQCQGICIGYRFGREPEMFVADQPLVGSMFTNDEMRIKARFIVAVGVGDYRGLHKSNVA